MKLAQHHFDHQTECTLHLDLFLWRNLAIDFFFIRQSYIVVRHLVTKFVQRRFDEKTECTPGLKLNFVAETGNLVILGQMELQSRLACLVTEFVRWVLGI